jgi:hypothetical protein
MEERPKEHEWLIFANAIVLPEGGQRASVVTAVCKRCGDVRSSLSPVDGEGRTELRGSAAAPALASHPILAGTWPAFRTDHASVANGWWT